VGGLSAVGRGPAQLFMDIIMPMPPHIIIIGMPDFIMSIMRRHMSMNISCDMPSIGIIWQVMPVLVISQVILPIIIGIIMPFIIGIIMPFIIGIMLPIMPPIIGIMPPMGIMPPIIGICMGIMPPIMGICIGIIGCMAAVILLSPSTGSVERPRGRGLGAVLGAGFSLRNRESRRRCAFLRRNGGGVAGLDNRMSLLAQRPLYWTHAHAATPGLWQPRESEARQFAFPDEKDFLSFLNHRSAKKSFSCGRA
jgi:hypothetical protein